MFVVQALRKIILGWSVSKIIIILSFRVGTPKNNNVMIIEVTHESYHINDVKCTKFLFFIYFTLKRKKKKIISEEKQIVQKKYVKSSSLLLLLLSFWFVESLGRLGSYNKKLSCLCVSELCYFSFYFLAGMLVAIIFLTLNIVFKIYFLRMF